MEAGESKDGTNQIFRTEIAPLPKSKGPNRASTHRAFDQGWQEAK